MKFYFRYCGTTAALPADDLADYFRHHGSTTALPADDLAECSVCYFNPTQCTKNGENIAIDYKYQPLWAQTQKLLYTLD